MSLILEKINENNVGFLYNLIQNYSVNLGLPINKNNRIIGFGKYENFYMYYIVLKDDMVMFTCRTAYNIDAEKKSIELKLENEQEIFSLIRNIYMDLRNSLFWKEFSSKNITPTKQYNIKQNNKTYYNYTNNLSDLDKALEKLKKLKETINLDIPYINNRKIPNRLYNILIKYVKNLNELTRYSANQIKRFRNCGDKTISELVDLIYFVTNSKTEIEDTKNTQETNINSKETIFNTPESQICKIIYDETDFSLIDESTASIWTEKANDIVSIFLDFINACLVKEYRNLEIFIKFLNLENKKVTLQNLGDEFNLSRERIRQIINKTVRKTKRLLKNVNYSIYLSKISQILEKIPINKIANFINIAFVPYYSDNLIKMLIFIILSENIYSAIIAVLKRAPKIEKISDYDTFFEQNAYFFDNNTTTDIDITNLKSATPVYSYKTGHERVKNQLKYCPSISKVIEYPNLCYYKTDFYPDFCIQTKNNKIILILNTRTINLAIKYNLERFNALHLFCKKHNCGYLILGDGFTSIYHLKQLEIPAQVKNVLDDILQKKNRITYKDLKQTRAIFPFSVQILVAYILQNKLKLTLDPFIIKR